MDKTWTKEELMKIMENDSMALKDLHDAKKYIYALNEFGPGQGEVDKMTDRQFEALEFITIYHEGLIVKLDLRIQYYEMDLKNAHEEFVRLSKEENDESNDNSNGQGD